MEMNVLSLEPRTIKILIERLTCDGSEVHGIVADHGVVAGQHVVAAGHSVVGRRPEPLRDVVQHGPRCFKLRRKS